jgi:SAM-dependent methyltransferase
VTADYSETWFETFLDTVPETQTEVELAFLRRVLPGAGFRRVLDIGCGNGRHASGLAASGRDVIGIDVSHRALTRALSTGSRARFVRADLRALPVRGPADAAIIMWQSFGTFDDRTNAEILRSLHGILRPGGRLVLDIYDRRFFESRLGQRRSVRNGTRVTERKSMAGNRLHVELRYDGSDTIDRFDWRVYSPDEIMKEVQDAGFSTVHCCAGFDEDRAATAELPRMQLVVAAAER